MLTAKQRLQTAARQQRFRERQHQARRSEQEAKGLPPLPAITTMPGSPRWKAALQSAHTLVAQISEEMRRYSDDRSEAWHESEQGETFNERLEAVEEVQGRLDDLIL